MQTFNYSALKAKKVDLSNLPVRFQTVGGAAYAVGTKIEIVGFGEFPAVREGGRPYVAACGVINGASVPVGANTLLGNYFNKDGRQTIENGVNDKPIASLMGKTLEVVKLVPVQVRGFNNDGTPSDTEREANMPVFKIVASDAKPVKGKKTESED